MIKPRNSSKRFFIVTNIPPSRLSLTKLDTLEYPMIVLQKWLVSDYLYCLRIKSSCLVPRSRHRPIAPVRFLSRRRHQWTTCGSQDRSESECRLDTSHVVLPPITFGGLFLTNGDALPLDSHHSDRVNIVLIERDG